MSTASGLALSACLMMLSLGLLYQLSDRRGWYSRRARLAMKGGTTLVAAGLAALGALWWPSAWGWWLAMGLMLCALADVLLELRFPLGMLAFALGHLCYIAALLRMGGLGAFHLVVFGLLAMNGLFVSFRLRRRLSQPVYFVYPYMLVIAMMLSLSLDKRLSMAVGAASFALSDALILSRLAGFGQHPRQGDAIMLLYYLGQLLIALTALPALF